MSGKYTNQLQACILFDGNELVSPPMVLNAFRMGLLDQQLPLSMVQESPDFVLMMGPQDLHITVTFFDRLAELSVFEGTLRSAFVNTSMPDARERVERHQSHILVEVRHGVLPDMSDNPEISSFLDGLGMKPGHSLDAFMLRCDVTAEICRHIIKEKPASVVHWTQSNLLVAGEKFAAISQPDHPGFLTVHPGIYGKSPIAGYEELPAGFQTLGAADYVGREIHMTPAPVPWPDLFEATMAFIRVATMDKGYVVPDDNIFGPEGEDFSCRVRHRAANTPGCEIVEEHYELTMERFAKHDYVSPDAPTFKPLPDGVSSVAQLLDPNVEEQRDLLDSFAAKERKATDMGGSFRVHLKDTPDMETPEPPAKPPKYRELEVDTYEADRPLNPDDPMDQAILRRLKERRESGEAVETIDGVVGNNTEAAPSGDFARSGSAFGRRKGGFGTRH